MTLPNRARYVVRERIAKFVVTGLVQNGEYPTSPNHYNHKSVPTPTPAPTPTPTPMPNSTPSGLIDTGNHQFMQTRAPVSYPYQPESQLLHLQQFQNQQYQHQLPSQSYETGNTNFTHSLHQGEESTLRTEYPPSSGSIPQYTTLLQDSPTESAASRKASLKANRLLSVFMQFLLMLKKQSILPEPPAVTRSAADFGIVTFLVDHGIDISTMLPGDDPQKSAEKHEFVIKLSILMSKYNDELDKLNHICADFCGKIITILREQSLFRPVGKQETAAKINSIQLKFDVVRDRLRQSVCDAILASYKQFESKSETDSGLQNRHDSVPKLPQMSNMQPNPKRRKQATTPHSEEDNLDTHLENDPPFVSDPDHYFFGMETHEIH